MGLHVEAEDEDDTVINDPTFVEMNYDPENDEKIEDAEMEITSQSDEEKDVEMEEVIRSVRRLKGGGYLPPTCVSNYCQPHWRVQLSEFTDHCAIKVHVFHVSLGRRPLPLMSQAKAKLTSPETSGIEVCQAMVCSNQVEVV